ncbi:S53 family peptidase [Kutzneria sp. CA-103260]|uniref:S53 family peptidase n=1 Tax=Kutzneria sp. CA-103260 TaxID=2802641 RepID=UPI001BA594B8|nr:S53 family peptidase [Kutzneria sp. CA-103260]QUQ68111.1 neutral zinc metalloprotease [Kutzneria sp. CA-103260]
MNRFRAAVIVGALLTLGLPATAVAAPDTTLHAACSSTVSTISTAHCFAVYRAPHAFGPNATPTGFGPADLRSAYKLPSTGGAGQTIAIVDAYDNPNAETDLASYRQQFGLPACTTANGCFKKVNQRGAASPLPEGDPGWGVEISLDLDMVSAACPDCHIVLVEADSATSANLGAAEDTAAASGASAVSNSYGSGEYNGMDVDARHYQHPGVAILASSGDSGFQPASFPASLPNVIAVGGTSLVKADNARGWTETAWSGAGSGCSAWIAKPAWQHDANCGMRTVSDVSAVADPNTGLAVYDTYGLGTQAGWILVGGTSASSPFIAGVIGLAGNGGQLGDASSLYTHADKLFDVVGGSNGYCGEDYLCTGLTGYDAPTGLGTPNGIGAF